MRAHMPICMHACRWHFGALSGIVMCHAKLGDVAEANRWASRGDAAPWKRSCMHTHMPICVYAYMRICMHACRWASEAMPRPGDGRKAWVKRMVGLLDERLAELAELLD